MRIKEIRIQNGKRFTDLTIKDIPNTAKLVVIVGPNGGGKSSMFDGFKVWHNSHGGPPAGYDQTYHQKDKTLPFDWSRNFQLMVYGQPPPVTGIQFYIRSAYRNNAEFQATTFHRSGPDVDAPKVSKMIETEGSHVQDNYSRIISAAVESLFDQGNKSRTAGELTDMLVGDVRDSMARVFDDLRLEGPGDPFNDGTFFFEKGQSKHFQYKNLSGGEKAAFDLLLDIIIKRRTYNDTVYCIDEPELHLHTRLQGKLLEELLHLLPDNCQLWLATHSIGMMRKAKEIYTSAPHEIAFLDFHNVDFDKPVTMTPSTPNRKFWANILSVALDDLASLVAPSRIILCEGERVSGKNNSEFDAKCYQRIFGDQYPDTEFISIGSADAVINDGAGVGRAIQTVVSGTKLIKLVDRDDKSVTEVVELEKIGVKVLQRRHLESYLLDDEILSELCKVNGHSELIPHLLSEKQKAITNSVSRKNSADDMKSPAGEIYNSAKHLLGLTQAGNDTPSFLRDTMAPLIRPGTNVYKELEHKIFS